MKIMGQSKNKQYNTLTVASKINILKLSSKLKPRKRAKKQEIKSVSQIVTSLGNSKTLYLDSPCGTIECIETSTVTNQTQHTQDKPVTSTRLRLLKDLKNERCFNQCKIKNKKPRNNHLVSSRPKNQKVKTICGTSTSNTVNDILQLGSGIAKSVENITSNPSSLKDLKNRKKLGIKPRKRNILKLKAENSNINSSSENSIVKMTSSNNANISGNTILQTLCSDPMILGKNRDFSLIESLMLTGNEVNGTVIKGDNSEDVCRRNEISASRKISKYSSSRLSSGKHLPSSIDLMKSRRVNDSSNNHVVCSIVVDSSDTNSMVNFYELGCSKFIILMKPKSNIAIIGTVEIQLLSGSIEVLGYNSHKEDEKLLIFSLQGSSHLTIKAKDPSLSVNKTKSIFEKLISLGLSEQLSHKVSQETENSVLFTIARNKADVSSAVWPKFFENHSSFSIFPNSQLFHDGSRPCHVVERKIKCLFESNLHKLGLKEFKEVSEWAAIANGILDRDHPKVILCGGKSVGKSSFLRYLVNKCLFKWKQILVLDFDLGQCEFTVPGCISVTLVEEPLFGPNYSHLKEPKRSVFLGEVDVTKCPENYIEGCRSLTDYAKREYGDIPWFINTMGFTKGFGVSLACGIINYLSPTHVIQIQSKDRKLNFPSLLEPKFVNALKHSAFDVVNNSMDYQLYTFPSGSEQPGFVSKSRGMSPAESRNLVILSYMSRMLNSTTTSLTQVTPYMISMEQLDLRTTNKYNLSKAQVAATMNGNIVALCNSIPSDEFLDCRGFGIVRAVDWQKGTIFLITPLPPSELSRVNCLVKGNVELPDSLYYNQGDQVTGPVPYLAHTSTGSTARFAKRDFRSLPVMKRDTKQYR